MVPSWQDQMALGAGKSQSQFLYDSLQASLGHFRRIDQVLERHSCFVSYYYGVYQKMGSPCGYFLISKVLNPPIIMLREPWVLE